MATSDPRDALEAGAKQWLSELSDDEFTSLVNEVREPEPDTPTITKGGGVAAGRARYQSGR
ncbi:hypothetical protein [Gordonia polyisoprenivorans]|uniref:hypothetical protein n=1 Tax=Gordonia polyisoprenivorans TaxID=84595 RepID=UPI002301BD33|nr:hypothetical protein [Gordonia polyisoprenivorans]WCB37923.1 hypothetical protein PHA63_01815 [Gordonia polyisoprenivorans]